jgi:hypothetical protein
MARIGRFTFADDYESVVVTVVSDKLEDAKVRASRAAHAMVIALDEELATVGSSLLAQWQQFDTRAGK